MALSLSALRRVCLSLKRSDSPSNAIALKGPQNATLVPARAIALGLCAPADVAKHPVLKLWGLRAITAPAAVLVQVRV